MPLPQTSNWQAGEQPSPGAVLWSSHSSGGVADGLTLPSPQVDGVQSTLQVAGVAAGSQASWVLTMPSPQNSRGQSCEQPSLSRVLLSSQSSPAARLTLPSPQRGSVQSRLQVAVST